MRGLKASGAKADASDGLSLPNLTGAVRPEQLRGAALGEGRATDCGGGVRARSPGLLDRSLPVALGPAVRSQGSLLGGGGCCPEVRTSRSQFDANDAEMWVDFWMLSVLWVPVALSRSLCVVTYKTATMTVPHTPGGGEDRMDETVHANSSLSGLAAAP
ncbi:hypothetical protein MG293_014388 [Ovis ammon polii]|uniref:Uncharacterized protein n=1 Tax=Ovis ammon polii TaxID=230172 RepID=A0AAD4TYQ9_OVIAM|nr:hypothetical protein MG293_014388 [Ovis ammon polii]